MNKATLISLEASLADGDGRSIREALRSRSFRLSSLTQDGVDRAIVRSLSEHDSVDLLQVQDNRTSMLSKSYSDGSFDLDSFPTPPAHLQRYPSFV